MPLLSPTALLEAVVMAGQRYGAFENRLSSYGAFKAYRDNAAALLPVDKLRGIRNQSNARDIVFPVLTKQTIPIITARSCTVTGLEPISAKPTITQITRGFEIKLFPIVFDNNEFAMQQGWANMFLNGMRAFLASVDTYAIGLLEAGKSPVLATVDLPGVTIASSAYVITLAAAADAYEIINVILEKNELGSDNYNNVANTEAIKRMIDYEKYHAGNEVDKAAVLAGNLQFTSPFRHYVTVRLVPGAGMQEVHYFVPFGGIGVFEFIHSDATNRRKGPNMEMYPLVDDIVGLQWDVREVPICEDITATYGNEVGYESAIGVKYQIATNLVFFEAYSSDTSRANIKINISKT
jgi:hypothetical protein